MALHMECQRQNNLQKEDAWSAPPFTDTLFSAMGRSVMSCVHTLTFSQMLMALGLPAADLHMQLAAHMLQMRCYFVHKLISTDRVLCILHMSSPQVLQVHRLVFQGLRPSQSL